MSVVRVFAGVCLTAWGAFMTVVLGPMSVVQGNGSALVMGVGFLAAGALTAVPESHRLSGFAALVSLAVGVLLIVAGYKLLLDYSGNDPGRPEPWPYRLAGVTLLVLGGVAIGRLPSRPAHRQGSGREA